MNQLEKTALGIVAPLPTPGTTRKSELLSACLHSVKAISGYLPRDPAASRTRYCNSLPIHSQKLLEEKFRNIVKHLTKTNSEIPFLWCEVLAEKRI